jgi:hypothetical protein
VCTSSAATTSPASPRCRPSPGTSSGTRGPPAPSSTPTPLPKKLVREAERLCRETLERGPDGKTIEQRRQEAVDAFARGKITSEQLVRRVGKPVDQWTAQDVGALEVLFDSLVRGDTTRDEAFGEAGGDGQERVTVDEIKGQGQAAAGTKATVTQMGRIHALLKDRSVESDEGVRQAIADILGRPVPSRKLLTQADADQVIAHLVALGEPPAPDGGEGQ